MTDAVYKLKAPSVTNFIVYKLAANYIHLKWDDSGSNFYYFIEMSIDGINWGTIGRTQNEYLFYDKLASESEYKFRISSNAEGFIQSDWVETETLKTFAKNLYNITKMPRLTLSEDYINKRLLDDNDYINFSRDNMYASLMSSGFTYLSRYNDVSQVSNYILQEESTHQIQGELNKICSDVNRVMIAQLQDVLYSFERFQPVIKVSNDRGQTWYYYRAFSDRVGNPISKTIAYQNSSTSYILGYQKLFYGRQPPADIRFSSDAYKFSNNELTFAKVGRDDSIPFETEIFSTFATLPADVTKYAEAFAANDEYCYVVARGRVRYIKLKNTPIIDDIDSPFYGERKFEDEVLLVTNSDKVVVKKMEVIDQKVFALVTGEVVHSGQPPTEYPVVDSDLKGVYQLIDSEFIRVFGNTQEQRDLITHEYTNMSTNGESLFIGTSNFNNNTEFTLGLTTNKNIHYSALHTDLNSNYTEWTYKTQEYYNEFNFSYFHRDKTRSWINNTNNAVVIYPRTTFSHVIDSFGRTSPNRVQKEYWKDGNGTIKAPNIEFNGFGKYAGGILIHRSTGEIFGYYEFEYRARDYVKLQWKPNLVVLQTELLNQTHEVPYKIVEQKGLKDPNLVPLLHKMNPDSYVKDDEFSMFITRYLEFISEGSSSAYIKLLNLIKNKNAREPDSFEYLFSEMYKRNIYLDKEKRDSVIRFFETRKGDFYSTKGTEQSYKFLFKLLYNEDVEIDIESKNSIEYDIIVESDDITEDIVGTTLYTPTGKANVTYIDREYQNGLLTWRITIHNLLGRYIEGQVIKSEQVAFTGLIKQGVRGKDMLANSIDYIDRGKSSYVMRIKSSLPASRYRDDILRFVHPVGFGFIGITLLTILINSGLNMKHTETIIRKLANYKFSSGYPTHWPDRALILTPDDNVTRDPITGEVLYKDHPRKGELFDIPRTPDQLINEQVGTTTEFDFDVPLSIFKGYSFSSIKINEPDLTDYTVYLLSDYDLEEGHSPCLEPLVSTFHRIGDVTNFGFAVPRKNWFQIKRIEIKYPNFLLQDYREKCSDEEIGITYLMPSDLLRRSRHSPLFDASGTAWSMFKNLQEMMLKDDLGHPRDPLVSTQEKIQ